MKLLSLTLAAALLSSAAAAAPLTVRLCTGGEDRPYHVTGLEIQKLLQDSDEISLEVVTTSGTWDNIKRTVLNRTPESCDAFIGQPDGTTLLLRENPAAAASLREIGKGPVEYLHVLCSAESGVTNLAELSGDNSRSIALGPEGSGAWLVWQNFIEQDSSYAEVQVSTESGAIAAAAVSANDTTCMLVPAAVPNASVASIDADFGDSIVLASAVDKDFNDAVDIKGRPLYTWADIPAGSYPVHFQAGWFTSIEAIAWRAGIYVRTESFKANPKALEALVVAAARVRPAIEARYGTLP